MNFGMSAKFILKSLVHILLAGFSGYLVTLAFAPMSYPVFLLIAVSIWLAVAGVSRFPFICGFAFGAVSLIFVSKWMPDAFLAEFNSQPYKVYIFYTLFVLLSASLIGLFSWFSKPVMQRILRTSNPFCAASNAVLLSAFFVVIEWLSDLFLPGVVFLDFSSVFARIPQINIISSYIEVYGLLFLLIFASCFSVWAAKLFQRSKPISSLLVLMVPLGIYLGVYNVGNDLLFRSDQSVTVPVGIAIISPDHKHISDDSDFDRLTRLRNLSLAAFEKQTPTDIRLIIWPELSLRHASDNDRVFLAVVKEVASRTNSWVLAGAISTTGDPSKIYNSAYLFNPEGRVIGQYDKYVPLPVFETNIPLVNDLVFTSVTPEVISGQTVRPIFLETDSFSASIGVLIGSDLSDPSVFRLLANQKSSIIVHMVDDSRWGKSSFGQQLSDVLVSRAVKYDVPVVRASSTGISAIVDQKGRRIAHTKTESSVLSGIVNLRPYKKESTARYQTWFPWLMTGVLVLALLLWMVKKRPRSEADTE